MKRFLGRKIKQIDGEKRERMSKIHKKDLKENRSLCTLKRVRMIYYTS